MPSAPHDSSTRTILVDGRPAPYTVRRSARARYARIQIHPRDGLQVVLPQTTPVSEASRLLHDKQKWLTKHALRIRRAGRAPLPMRDGERLPYRGEWYPLAIDRALKTAVRCTSGAIHVRLNAPHDEAAVRAALERWYRREARRVLLDRIRLLRDAGDPTVRRVTIRDQDTRWGSCSSAGTLSFNWRLVMAPPPVADAVVVHELVHLSIADHSPTFWNALQERFPRHAACRRWLDANAYRLRL